MNIVFIIIDAIRPDHLGINGYKRNTSPNIDKLAKNGIFFSNTYAPLPNSEPSITSMLTGIYPHSTGVRMLFKNKLKPSITTLQEILKAHGYKTAFMKCGFFNKKIGIERGFDQFEPLKWKIEDKINRGIYKIFHPNKALSVTQQYTKRAIKYIRKNSNKRFFLCLYYIDSHWPYEPPSPYDNMFDLEYKGKHSFNNLDNGKIKRSDLMFGNKKLSKRDVEHAIAHYDGGIRHVDTHIKKIFNLLKKEKLDKETLIVICSDHGESFGEHNYFYQHGEHLYESGLKSTMIISNPKIIPKGKKIRSRIQNLDIMPTILDMLNITIIDRLDGVSLLPLIHGKKKKIRDFVFSESVENSWKENKRIYFEGVKGKWRSMIIDDWKIIYIPHPKKSIFELYNLKNDPHEKNNLINKNKKIATEMKKMILEYLKTQSNKGKTDLSSLTEKSRKLLKSLGYIE